MSSLATPPEPSTRPRMLYVGTRTGVVAAAAERADAVLASADGTSRSEALDRVDATVDCLVVDAMLPTGTGVDLLETARQTQPDLAGVVLVGSGPVPETGTDPPTDYVRVADGPGPLATRVAGVLAQGEGGRSSLEDQVLDRGIRNAPDPVVVVDDRAKVRYANAAVEDVVGHDPSTMVGSPIVDLLSPDRREAFLDAFARCVAGETTDDWVDVSVRGHHRNGRPLPLSISISAARHSDERLYTAIVRDVTEQREREATLRRQRDELAELERINEVIRRVARALVDATSRSEIERAVCDCLAESGPYELAWIGQETLGENNIVPRVEGGDEDGYLDRVSSSDTGSLVGWGPAGQAYRNRTVTVVDDVATDERFEPWRDAAIDCGLRSVAVVPLQYGETVFGVLALYDDEAGAFDERETTVLSELGGMIAHALTAVDRKQALVTDERVELEFRLSNPDYFFSSLTAECDADLTLEGMVPRSAETDLVYATVHTTSPATVESAAASTDAIAEASVVADRGDRCCFEFTATGDTVASTLASYGATVTSMTATDGVAHITAELPATAEVRPLVAAVTAEFDGIELVAQRERHGAGGSERGEAALLDSLTDRQRAALETAYRSGYFEWPRDRTAEEVAESLDIASPTLHNHLRLAQAELFGSLFEDD